jgi:TetR/AcrR family transcriptional repressor of nem operon
MEPSTSERILDVAQSLVVAGGYNGFSYADISEAIGIRKASIHHHFPTKAALVSVLVGRYVRQAQEGLKSLRDHVPDPIEQLNAYLAYWQKCVLDSSEPFCVCAMLASEMQMLPDEVALQVRVHFQSLAEWLASVLKSGKEQGAFRLDVSPGEEAQILMASVHGALLSARALGDAKLFLAILGPQVARLRA